MISICIPIYNRNVTRLVCDLNKQCQLLDVPYEIVLIDDASDALYRESNSNLMQYSGIRYKQLKTNIGRAAIRNLFATETIYPYLLFLDNDAEICSDYFIQKYIDVCAPHIICYGGCSYFPCNDQRLKLRWMFGTKRESIPFEKRVSKPNYYFSTFNFLIYKNIIISQAFDDTNKGYGYEDVLFRIKAIEKGYSITQINNPLIHDGLISNEEFLKKTELSLRKLKFIYHNSESKLKLASSIKILKVYHNLKIFRLTSIISTFFGIFKTSLKKNLLSKKPRLFVFDLYKLGYICTLNSHGEEC